MIYSPKPVLGQGALSPVPALTIELLAQATSESTQGIAHILSFYDNAGMTFFLGQWKSHLIMRSRVSEDSLTKRPYKTIDGFREVGLHQVFPSGKTSIVTVASNHAGTTVYVDGAMSKHYEGFTLLHDMRNPGERIVLGNSPTGTQQWDGVISGLALYGRLLSAAEVSERAEAWSQKRPYQHTQTINPLCLCIFNEGNGEVIHDHTGRGNNLVMPVDFMLLRKTFLSLPRADYFLRRSFMQDALVNIAGFMPLGVFLSLILSRTPGWSRRRTLIVTVVSGLCFSLSIELVQAYVPGRDSSLTDLVTNTLGAALGIVLSRVKGTGVKTRHIETH